MKKIIFFPLVILAALTTFSCHDYWTDASRTGYSRSADKNSEKELNNYVQNLALAINEKNPKKVKNLMSYKARNDYTDEDIENLFSLFSSKIKTPVNMKTNGMAKSDSMHVGKHISSLSTSLILQTEDNRYYELNIGIIYLDDYYEKNEGIMLIEVQNDNYAASNFRQVETDKRIVAYKRDSIETGYTEVRKVGFFLRFYKPVQRKNPVTREAIINFIQKTKSYSDFKNHFGEENMSGWWEMGNKTYINISADGDEISRITIENEDGFVEELWSKWS